MIVKHYFIIANCISYAWEDWVLKTTITLALAGNKRLSYGATLNPFKWRAPLSMLLFLFTSTFVNVPFTSRVSEVFREMIRTTITNIVHAHIQNLWHIRVARAWHFLCKLLTCAKYDPPIGSFKNLRSDWLWNCWASYTTCSVQMKKIRLFITIFKPVAHP